MRKEAKITSKGQATVPRGVRVRAAKKESPFAKYRGIGVPGMRGGRAGVIRFVRRLRGE